MLSILSILSIYVYHLLYCFSPILNQSQTPLTCSNFLNPARIIWFLVIIWKQEFEDFNCLMAFQTSSPPPTYLAPISFTIADVTKFLTIYFYGSQSFCKPDNQISSIHTLCSVVFLRKQDAGGDRIQLALFNRLVALFGGRTTLNLFSICHYSMLKVALLYVYPAINNTHSLRFCCIVDPVLLNDPIVA